MNAQSNLPATRAEATQQLQQQLSVRAEQFKAALPGHISLEKFQSTVITAVQSDPELLRANRQSFLLACQKAAQDGLLPDKREAALVIFKRNFKDAQGAWQQALEVAYMPMVYGLRKKILQSGEITDISTNVVYRREAAEGAFLYEEGTERYLRHRPMLDLSKEDADDANIIAAYSMATFRDGSRSFEVMRRFEIDEVREVSQTGATKDRYGKDRKPSGPWVDWFAEMAKKTVMRRHSKTLPMSGDLVDVEAQDEVNARSLDNVLSIPGGKAVALPPHQAEGDGGTFDHETGELLTDQSASSSGVQLDERGMTQVDEQTARELDQQGEPEPETAKRKTKPKTAAKAKEPEPEGESEQAEATDRGDDDRRAAENWVAQLERSFANARTDVEKRGIHDANAQTLSELEAVYPDLHKRAMAAIPDYDPEATAPADDEPLDPHRGKPWAEKRREFLDRLAQADDKAEVKRIEDEMTRIFVQFPPEIQDELEDAMTGARRRIRNAEEASDSDG